MQALIEECIEGAMRTVTDHALLIGHENVDEATFRSFLIAEIKRRHPNARCQTEWRLFDLLLQFENDAALIEIKFYFSAKRTILVDGSVGDWKGGPGVQNEREF